MKTAFKTLAVATLLASAGLAAFSQTHEGMADHDAMMGQGRMHKMDSSKMESMMGNHLAKLKEKLKLSTAQEGAWTTFTGAMKPPANMMDAHPDRAEMDKLTTPERIDKMKALRTQHMADMNTSMDKRDEAIKTFYATLTPEQKKTFDTEHARMGGAHGR